MRLHDIGSSTQTTHSTPYHRSQQPNPTRTEPPARPFSDPSDPTRHVKPSVRPRHLPSSRAPSAGPASLLLLTYFALCTSDLYTATYGKPLLTSPTPVHPHKMVSFSFTCVLAAAAMVMTVSAQSSEDFWSTVTTPSAIASPTTTLPANAMSTIGCFETGTPLENYGYYNFQSPGNCQFLCIEHNKNVLGLSNGVDCWCGDKIPAKEWQVDNSSCNTQCKGTSDFKCLSSIGLGLSFS